MTVKLVQVQRSPVAGKKWRAVFQHTGGSETHTDFGATGYADYTMHHDKQRRDRYIQRHLRDLATDDPTRAGYLSMYILWNKRAMAASVADYRKRLAQWNKTGAFPKRL